MKVYLNHPVETVEWDALQVELQKHEPLILFLRNKVMKREEALQTLIEQKEKYEVGEYTVVVW